MGQILPLTNIVQSLTINGRIEYGVLRIRTRDCWIVGADESTELWHCLRH